MDDDLFRLADDPAQAATAAEAAFQMLRDRLRAALPAGAGIEHIGATAVPGCETKGDLDIVVRVSAADFPRCRELLDVRFARNEGSVRNDVFAAYEHREGAVPVGIQLVVRGSPLDGFTRFRDRLLADPQLVRDYNALKRQWHGKPGDAYRAAKDAFIARALDGTA